MMRRSVHKCNLFKLSLQFNNNMDFRRKTFSTLRISGKCLKKRGISTLLNYFRISSSLKHRHSRIGCDQFNKDLYYLHGEGLRNFSSYHHNISESSKIPPSSENPGYLNRFDQADNADLWKEEEKLKREHSKTDKIENLVEPSNHPHHYEGLLVRERYAHYCQTKEPTFPQEPDIINGELASGANVTRTSVWHDQNEPAIVSVGRFSPDNFRPIGYAENVPNPDSINSDSHPDFRHYRLPENHADRKSFIYFVSASYFFIGASMIRSLICKAVHQWWIPKDVQASGSTEVDLSSIKAGQQMVVKWRGKPVFIKHRTSAEIDSARKDDEFLSSMKDPQLDSERAVRPEWLINIGVCTHLGCIPTEGGSYGGWFCPCHGSHYDISGRIRQGPAPANLEIPPHQFLTDVSLKLG